MKIRKGRLETKGGFGLKTRKGRPEYAELGIPQGTLSEICASQNGSHICQHHHLKRSLPNKGRNRGKKTRTICRWGNRHGTSYAATEEAASTSIQKANNIFNNSLSVRDQEEWKPLFSTTAYLPVLRENRTPLGSAHRGEYFYKA
ncbi:hypothetical protein V6N13_115173 [Hibiscus sabdariffa]